MTSHRGPHYDTTLLLAAFCGVGVWSVWEFFRTGFFFEQTIHVCRITGYAALGFLAVPLLTGPLLRCANWCGMPGDRELSARVSRNSGIASALAAIGHTIVVLLGYLDTDWQAVLRIPYLQSGGLALLILIVLLIGSCKPFMAMLRWKLWKPLFRLSFAAAAVSLHHILYAPFSSTTWTLGMFGAAGLLLLFRLLPIANKSGPEPSSPLEENDAGRESNPLPRPHVVEPTH